MDSMRRGGQPREVADYRRSSEKSSTPCALVDGSQPAALGVVVHWAPTLRLMQIRRASPEDRDEVASLLGQADLPALPPCFPLTNLAVALENSSVVGAVALTVIGRVGLLRSAAVAPSHARQGVGTSLIQNLLARAHELGLRELRST